MPFRPIRSFSAVTPNGSTLDHNFFDSSIYIKGDRQDSLKLYDVQLLIEYEPENPLPQQEVTIGTVQQVTGVNHTESDITYEGGTEFTEAVVFASPLSFNGAHTAHVEFTDVSSTGASLLVEEPDHLQPYHKKEDFTLLTLEKGSWTLSDGSQLEVGKTTVDAGPVNTLTSVTFDTAFEEAPVVLVQVQTDNSANWLVVRADNVTTTGFNLSLQTEEAVGGAHAQEVVGWAALDASAASGLLNLGRRRCSGLRSRRCRRTCGLQLHLRRGDRGEPAGLGIDHKRGRAGSRGPSSDLPDR